MKTKKTKRAKRKMEEIIDSSLVPSAAAKGLFPKLFDLKKKR